MSLDIKKTIEILLKQNYITAEDVKAGEEYSKIHPQYNSVDYLLSENLITKDLIGQATAEFYKIPYADLNSKEVMPEYLDRIPEDVARSYRIVLFEEDGKSVNVTTDSPENDGLGPKLRDLFPGKRLVVSYSLPEDIDQIFVRYRKPLETRFSSIIESEKRVAPEIIQEIFTDAITYRASDIHFEPQEKAVVIRFRIDGVLQEAGRISKELYENVLNRIKVLAHLRIDDHFSAQDGSIRHALEGSSVDMRVSITPTLDGEKIVIRILSEYVRSLSLTDLGLSYNDQEILNAAARKPFGMILVTGPTGSGKTTTLYALLKILNKPDVNITTIEDPVEYKILGANQIQVNTQTNLSFAHGLRSIVRQDPDIILVGEIRDEETAEIAVNAALTGHLLLSTFHANDAATAIPRLLDMGVEPFLLSSTLQVLIAQRLVRRICASCRHSVKVERADLMHKFPDAMPYLPESKEYTFYRGKGCKICNQTGYKGRMAIYEFINVTPEMQDLILHNPSTKQIWELGRSQGSHSLFEDGIEKVLSGITTFDEVYRVASPPHVETPSREKRRRKA